MKVWSWCLAAAGVSVIVVLVPWTHIFGWTQMGCGVENSAGALLGSQYVLIRGKFRRYIVDL
jgi:hypothetical protein